MANPSFSTKELQLDGKRVTISGGSVYVDGIQIGIVGVTKSTIGLGNVTNDAQVKRTEMAVADGVATLNSSGLIPYSQLPHITADVWYPADETEMLALSALMWDVAFRADVETWWLLTTNDPTNINDWIQLTGYSGYSGYCGLSGYSGFCGAGVSGFSGFSGYSGKSGYSGFSGKSGFSGYSGYSGSGLSGYSGDSGFSGSGISGYSGYCGLSGYSGFSGFSGANPGASGYSGYSGQGAYTGSSHSADYTLVLGDANSIQVHSSSDSTTRTFTIPSNASVAYPLYTTITFVNESGAGNINIAINSDTMYLAGLVGTTGTRTLIAVGMATAIKVATTTWVITGTNLT